MLPLTLLVIAFLAIAGFAVGRNRAITAADGKLANLHSRPSYHGLYCLLWIVIVGYGAYMVAGTAMSSYVAGAMRTAVEANAPDLPDLVKTQAILDAQALATGGIASADDELRRALSERYIEVDSIRTWVIAILSLIAAGAAFYFTYRQLNADFRARNRAERILRTVLWLTAAVAILTTIGIVLSLVGETLNFFASLNWRVDAFLFGTTWSPLSGVHEGALSAEKVGAVPLFLGTFMITLIAMIVAVPVGLFAAVYLSEFATPRVRAWAKPLLEVLAGVPTVVYGFFAAITVAPAMVGIGDAIGLNVEAESALAAGLVMGIMIIPFISSLSDDVINAVPQALRDGSFGLGATKAETIMKVVLPAALPGIVSAVLLGISRAVGETMIVVMAVGQSANLTFNPLDKVTTVTVQIVMLILGDTEAETAAGPAYALGFTLFFATLGLNILALRMVRKYRQKYD